MSVSGYRTMWIFVMFDLPMVAPEEKHAYRKFLKALKGDGFDRMQFSIYLRHCPSEENADVHVKRVTAQIPAMGQVRILRLTDKQFGRMQVFFGKLPQKVEEPWEQLTLF